MLDKQAIKRDLKRILFNNKFGNEKDKEKAEDEYRALRKHVIRTIGATPEEFNRIEQTAKAEFEVFDFEMYEVATKMAKVRDSFAEQNNLKAWSEIREALIANIEDAHELKLPVEKAESSKTSEPRKKDKGEDKTLLNACENLTQAINSLAEAIKRSKE